MMMRLLKAGVVLWHLRHLLDSELWSRHTVLWRCPVVSKKKSKPQLRIPSPPTEFTGSIRPFLEAGFRRKRPESGEVSAALSNVHGTSLSSASPPSSIMRTLSLCLSRSRSFSRSLSRCTRQRPTKLERPSTVHLTVASCKNNFRRRHVLGFVLLDADERAQLEGQV